MGALPRDNKVVAVFFLWARGLRWTLASIFFLFEISWLMTVLCGSFVDASEGLCEPLRMLLRLLASVKLLRRTWPIANDSSIGFFWVSNVAVSNITFEMLGSYSWKMPPDSLRRRRRAFHWRRLQQRRLPVATRQQPFNSRVSWWPMNAIYRRWLWKIPGGIHVLGIERDPQEEMRPEAPSNGTAAVGNVLFLCRRWLPTAFKPMEAKQMNQ